MLGPLNPKILDEFMDMVKTSGCANAPLRKVLVAMSTYQNLPGTPDKAPARDRSPSASGPVTRYRCYLMDGNGDFLDVVTVDCEADNQAIREALKARQREKRCKGFQVWRGLRMVYQQGKANLIVN